MHSPTSPLTSRTSIAVSADRLPLALVGASEAAVRAREALAAAAALRTPVLIVSEPGCRATEIASALHEATRGSEPMVVVDCASSAPSELAGRLFGTAPSPPGATDLEPATSDAAVVAVGEGTLVLDHVDDLPASLQRRLARAIRDGEVALAGSPAPCVVLGRVVAITSRDLDAEVRDGRFRDDLRRRFATRIEVPPLRQRAADIPEMLQRITRSADGAARTFTQPAVTMLCALPWLQNIDELAAVVERVLNSADATVRQEDVLAHVPMDGAFARVDLTASLRDARRRFERDYIAAVLERHQWRMSEAARALGIERANLYRKTRQLGIARMPRTETD